MRWIAAALVGAGLAACGGVEASSPRTNVAPPEATDGALSVASNQNAPAPSPEPFEAEALSLMRLYCSQAGGAACQAAEQELGVDASPADTIPEVLLERARDTEDDCNDPDVAPLMQRVTRALGAGGTWSDQIGQVRTQAMVGDPYSGSGCMNRRGPAEPLVKIHVADTPDGARFLVRVWEVGDGR